MKTLIKRLLLSLRTRMIKIIFFPLFAYTDLKNRQLIASKGDVISIETLRSDTSGVFCVFLIYPLGRFSGSLRRALQVLNGLGVNIVAVCNKPPLPDDRAFLEGLAHTIILRRNVGRDFGGYRTGVLHVLNNLQPDRIVIANDSVYYLNKGLKDFFADLCGPHDFVGAAENHEFGYHVGSYTLGFGPRVIRDPRFRHYWESYRLTELRPAVIKTGEIALNHLIIREMGVIPHVIFSPTRMVSGLATAEIRDLMATVAMMPAPYPQRHALVGLHERATAWNHPGAPSDSEGQTQLTLAAASISQMETENLVDLVTVSYRRTLERSLLDFVYRGSQIHWGTVILLRHLSCPIVKTDLLVRGIFSIGELAAFASLMPEEEFEEFFDTVTRRGSPAQHWNLVQRMMLSVGYI